MYNFLSKLLNFMESSTDHTNSEIVIADYILRHVNELPMMTIYQLADACHTSPATISRFCRRFDNITFKELKEYAQTFIEFNHSEVNFEQIDDNFQNSHIEDYFANIQHALDETKKVLVEQNNLLPIAKKIYQAKKISFFGVTFSHLIARNAQFKFIRLGKYASNYSNHDNQLAEATTLTKRDLAIVVSFSGETRFIVRLVKALTRNNIPIVAITGNPSSFLAKHASYVVPVSNTRLANYKSPIVEEFSMLSAINSIYFVYSIFLNRISDHVTKGEI